MSITPSTNQVRTAKLLESFCSFYEKIGHISANSGQNSRKLSLLKKIVYGNLESRSELTSKYEESFGPIKNDSKSASSIPSLPEHVESLQRSELKDVSSVVQTPVKPRKSFQDEARSPISHSKNNSLFIGRENPSDKSFRSAEINRTPTANSNNENMPVTSFLTKIKAASHKDMSQLFSMTSNYIYVRSFQKTTQPLFKTLCFAYFEKLLKENTQNIETLSLKNLKNILEIEEDLPLSENEANEYDAFIKDCAQNIINVDTSKKLYETLSSSSSLSLSLLSIFKLVVTKYYSAKLRETISKGYSFEWIDDLNGGLDQTLYQNLAYQVFKCNLKVMILTPGTLIEKLFTLEGLNNKKCITIFYDQSTHCTYLLYPLRRPVEEDLESPSFQKLKAKLNEKQFNKPPLNSEFLKNLKTNGPETATTLDTVASSPLNSLNEIDIKDKNRERDRNSQLKGLSSRANSIKNTNTLNLFSHSLYDITESSGYPESTVAARTVSDKLTTLSPLNSSHNPKSVNKIRTENDIEDSLVPKDKEPVPQRSNSYNVGSSNSNGTVGATSIDDKLFNKVYEKAKNEMIAYTRQTSNPLPNANGNISERNKERERSSSKPYIERFSTQDYSSPKSFTTDPRLRYKTDYINSDKSQNLDTSGRNYASGTGNSIRITGLSSTLKPRFDKFNHTVNLNDQDFIKVAGKHLTKNEKPNSAVKDKGAPINSLIGAYQNILNHSQEMHGFRPTVGIALKMDER